jgi:hypothetical protein
MLAAFAFTAAAVAQDSASAPPSGRNSSQEPGGSYGHRGYGGGMGMMGRGLMGAVTEVAADRYTIKTDSGDVYTVHFTSSTHFIKQVAGTRGPGGGQGAGDGMRNGRGNPPQEIQSSAIKPGDTIRVMGDVDTAAKSVAATAVVQLDPAVAQQMRAMEANFGKTWLMGKVASIDGVKITLTGALDNAPHTFVADENTEFRKRREPATLADIQVGDTIRVEGAVKDGAFTAASVNVGGMMGGAPPTVPRNSPPQ